MKTNTRKRSYHVAVSEGGKVHTTVTVTAESVREALKHAYEKVSGWQGVPSDGLD